MLKGAAARLLGCVRQGDTLARLGGDEFVVVLEGLHQAEDAAQVAVKILEALSLPFEIAGHTLITSCSIGISIFPDDAADERALMKNADMAMYHAKERGRNNYQFFSPDMNVRAVERLNLESAMRLAMEREEFVLLLPAPARYPQRPHRRHGGADPLAAPGAGSARRRTSSFPWPRSPGLIEPMGEWVLLHAPAAARAHGSMPGTRR